MQAATVGEGGVYHFIGRFNPGKKTSLHRSKAAGNTLRLRGFRAKYSVKTL
jgi:hypothetical protein